MREVATARERERVLQPKETPHEGVLADLKWESPGEKVSEPKRPFEAKKSDIAAAQQDTSGLMKFKSVKQYRICTATATYVCRHLQHPPPSQTAISGPPATTPSATIWSIPQRNIGGGERLESRNAPHGYEERVCMMGARLTFKLLEG